MGARLFLIGTYADPSEDLQLLARRLQRLRRPACRGLVPLRKADEHLCQRAHLHRPAVLWETAGAPVRLTGGRAAPGWSTEARSGEALWPAPG